MEDGMNLSSFAFFNRKKIEVDLQIEYATAMSTDQFHICLSGHIVWFNGGHVKICNLSKTKHKAVYRGWMMKPEQNRRSYNQMIRAPNFC